MTPAPQKHLISILILLAGLTLSACRAAEPMPFEQVCQPENNQKVVSTDGYFSLGETVYCSDTSGDFRCRLVFNAFPDANDKFSAELKEGNRRNQMKHLNSGYMESDLQIKTDNGTIVGVGDHVIISGKMLVSDEVCLMLVDKVAPFDPEQ